jgi:hypothetical protein
MSAIDRIMGAQTFDKGQFLVMSKGKLPQQGEQLDDDVVPGEFDLKIKKIVYRANSQTIGEMIAVEFEVTGTNTEKAPVGSLRSWVQTLAKSHGLSAYKAFLYAALGAKSPEQKVVADKVLPKILTAIEQNQPHQLLDRTVHCTVRPHCTREKKWVTINVFTSFEEKN